MRKTILTHFYNEEYLLPWWLEHHKKYFDHGVLFNYDSTDRSVEIIKDICPTWEIISSKNKVFDAALVDKEIMDYEPSISGWKICLNITEFLVGDFSVLSETPDTVLTIPCSVMVDIDWKKNSAPNYDRPLIEQKPYGIYYKEGGSQLRRSRAVHNKPTINYPLGRHFESYDCEELQVLWYGWSPFTIETIKRKLQIQYRIPGSDRIRGFGREHFTDQEKIKLQFKNEMLPKARDLSKELNV